MIKPLLLTIGVLLAGAAVVVACSSGTEDQANETSGAAQPSPSMPGEGAPSAPPAAGSPGVPPGTGLVLETVDAGTYTYVRVDLGGKEAWAAGPQVAVKPGDFVSLPAGMAMNDFYSKSLDRTFPLVWFVGAIQVGGGSAPAAATAVAAAHQGIGNSAAATAAPIEPVARLEGGQTVEEIVQKRTELAGKDIAVRARVVKFSGGIMGANWIHIRDGSGAVGTNDLTVTTDATVAVGDVVVVRGRVSIDKDFGAGYAYAVIVEKASVEKAPVEKAPVEKAPVEKAPVEAN